MVTVDHWSVTRLPDIALLQRVLEKVFPQGTDYREWATAERAARSLFVFLYVFAVEGVTENRLRPAMVTSMSDPQAARQSVTERLEWWAQAARPRPPVPIEGRWYAENTREPIRDETFRAWKEYGVVREARLPTNSALPRYQLARDFVDLFDPALDEQTRDRAIASWQEAHLPPAARARIALNQQLAIRSADTTLDFSDGVTRHLDTGPSTPLLKAVIERFAPKFLHQPVVLTVTESRQHLAYEDRNQLARIRLRPDPRLMPDVVLADPASPDGHLRLVLLECVATAGAMTPQRVREIRSWLFAQRFVGARVAFGTVFQDCGSSAFRTHIGTVAWGTFVWLASEPDNLILLIEEGSASPTASLETVARPI